MKDETEVESMTGLLRDACRLSFKLSGSRGAPAWARNLASRQSSQQHAEKLFVQVCLESLLSESQRLHETSTRDAGRAHAECVH